MEGHEIEKVASFWPDPDGGRVDLGNNESQGWKQVHGMMKGAIVFPTCMPFYTPSCKLKIAYKMEYKVECKLEGASPIQRRPVQ